MLGTDILKAHEVTSQSLTLPAFINERILHVGSLAHDLVQTTNGNRSVYEIHELEEIRTQAQTSNWARI